MVNSYTPPDSCLRDDGKLVVKGDHGDGSETASTASSEASPGGPLARLKRGGFGGFGPAGSWFWSPSSAATRGNSGLLEPGLLDCLEPWDREEDMQAGTAYVQHWGDLFRSLGEESNAAAKEEVASRLSHSADQGTLQPLLDSSVLEVSNGSEKQPSNALIVSQKDGVASVEWKIDSRKLYTKDKKAVSPSFNIELGGQVAGSFRIILTPSVVSQARNGACFRKAKGWGVVELKSESVETLDPLVMQASLWRDNGKEEIQIKCSPPVRHDFSGTCVCAVSEEWDFSAAVDQASLTFSVHLAAFAHRQS